MVFITELRLCFLATQQQTNSDKNQVDESQHISNHSRYYKLWHNGRFLYSVHVIAFRTAGLQNLRASPPSQHIWTIWHSDKREPQGEISQRFEYSGAKERIAWEGCRERSGVTFYWLICINNQGQAVENAAFIEEWAWRKCCQLRIIMSQWNMRKKQ